MVKFFDRLNEVKRLKRKYPSASDVIWLSSLYPDYFFSDNDAAIAVKKEHGASKMDVFEERTQPDILETAVIPIEYHSAYGRGVAESIKKAIDANPELFGALLLAYDKISLDKTKVTPFDEYVQPDDIEVGNMIFKSISPKDLSNVREEHISSDSETIESSEDDVLIITDYCSDVSVEYGYQVSKFVDAIFRSYKIDTKKHPDMAGRALSNYRGNSSEGSIYANIDFDFLSFQELIKFYIVNKKYDDLKSLLECRLFGDADRYKVLNSILGSVTPIILENVDILLSQILKMNGANKRKNVLGTEKSAIPMSKEKTISLARDFLSRLDFGGRDSLAQRFDEALKAGKLLERKTTKDASSVHTLQEDGTIDDSFLRYDVPADSICLEFTDSATDVINLIGSFIRYYINAQHTTSLRGDDAYIKEMFPRYFESRAADFLIDKCYNTIEIDRIRACKANQGKISDSSISAIVLMNRFKTNNGIDENSLFSNDEIEAFYDSRCGMSFSEFKSNSAAGYIGTFISAGKGEILPSSHVGCALGMHFAEGAQNNTEMDKNMVLAFGSYLNGSLSADNIVTHLRNGTIAKTLELEKMLTGPTQEQQASSVLTKQ